MEKIYTYGKIGTMYISSVFRAVDKVSLSKDIKDAIDLCEIEQKYVEENLGADIKKYTYTYNEEI